MGKPTLAKAQGWATRRHYALGERGRVLVNAAQKAEMRVRGIA